MLTLLLLLLLRVKNSLFGLAERISGLRESVAGKRAEVEKIKRIQRLCSIVSDEVTKTWTGYLLLSENSELLCCVYGVISGTPSVS